MHSRLELALILLLFLGIIIFITLMKNEDDTLLNYIHYIFMKDYFLPKAINHNLRLKKPLEIPKVRTTNYGIRSSSFQGPKIWNSLPDELKTWFLSNKCACSFCNK